MYLNINRAISSIFFVLVINWFKVETELVVGMQNEKICMYMEISIFLIFKITELHVLPLF